MSAYKQMYLELSKAMSEAIDILQKGQIAAKEIYMCGANEDEEWEIQGVVEEEGYIV